MRALKPILQSTLFSLGFLLSVSVSAHEDLHSLSRNMFARAESCKSMDVKEFEAYPKCERANKEVVDDECNTDQVNKKLDDKICKDEVKDLKDADSRREGRYAARELKQCYQNQKTKFQELKNKCIEANTKCVAECDAAKIPSQDGGREICEASVNKAKAAISEKAAACQSAKNALAEKIDTAVAKIDDTLNNDIFRNQRASRYCDGPKYCDDDKGNSNDKATASGYSGGGGGLVGFGAGIITTIAGNFISLPTNRPSNGYPYYGSGGNSGSNSNSGSGSSNSGSNSTSTTAEPTSPVQPAQPEAVRTVENSIPTPNPAYYRFTPSNATAAPSTSSSTPSTGSNDSSSAGNSGGSAPAYTVASSNSSSSSSGDISNSKVPGFNMKAPSAEAATTSNSRTVAAKSSANVYQGFEYAAVVSARAASNGESAGEPTAPRNFEGASPIQERNVRSAGRTPASVTDTPVIMEEPASAPERVSEEPALGLRVRTALLNWFSDSVAKQSAQKEGTATAVKTEEKPISTAIVEAVVEKVPSLKGFLSQVLKSTGPTRMTGMEAAVPGELLGANENLFHHVNGRYQRLQGTLIEEQN